MYIIIVSWIGSIVISIFIGNVVGCHFMDRLNKNWIRTFNDMENYISTVLDEIIHNKH